MENKALLRLSEIGMSWGDKVVLRDVNCVVNRGDFVAVTGPNGGGKTTLMRIILGLLTPSAGLVEWIDGFMPETGYLPQKNLVDSRFPITVHEVVNSGLLSKKGLSGEERQKLVDEMLHNMELNTLSNEVIGNLSGGQLQRTMLARAIVANPDLIVLDEPLSYIDARFEMRFYDLLYSYIKSKTIIMVTHRTEPVERFANRHFVVDGTIVNAL